MNKRVSGVLGALLTAGLQVHAGGLVDVFDEVDSKMETRIFDSTTTLDSDVDPLLAESSFGINYARARYADGDLRGKATIADAFGNTLFAAASFGVTFKNLSGSVATIGAGDLRLTIDASFARSFGTGAPNGTVGNTLESNLQAAIGDSSGVARYVGTGNLLYQYTDSQSDGAAPDIRVNEAYDGGFTATRAFDGDEFSAVISAPELVILPGDTVFIGVTMIGTATAFGFFGGSGYTATTDFGNTALLSLVMPVGFSVQSTVPLNWITVTPVPEPAPAAMLIAGLAVMGLLARRRSTLSR
jgi:hypothetical protein